MQFSLLILSLWVVSASLFLSSAEGNSFYRRYNGERARRQGFIQDAERPSLEGSNGSRDELQSQKLDVPALYSLPRAAPGSSGPGATQEVESSSIASDQEDTTTELITNVEETFELEEQVGEAPREDVIVNPTQMPGDSSPDILTSKPELVDGNTEEQQSNGLILEDGNSHNSRGNIGGENGEDYRRKFNSVLEANMLPFTNEIPEPYSFQLTNDQQKLQNSFYQTQQAEKQNSITKQQEAFEQYAASIFNQPPKYRFENRPAVVQENKGPGGYNYPQQDGQFFEAQPHPVQSQRQFESINGNALDPGTEEITFDGLRSDIVDEKLLERVQQIIEDHEKEQKEVRTRLSQNPSQFLPRPYTNGNPGFLQQESSRGYDAAQGLPLTSSARNTNLFLQETTPPQLSDYNSQQEPNPFRETKSFPGNPNLEIQPAILRGQFVETRIERKQEERGSSGYLPPSRRFQFQNYQQQQRDYQEQGTVQGQKYPSKQQYQEYSQQQIEQKQELEFSKGNHPHHLPIPESSPPYPFQSKAEGGFQPSFLATQQGYEIHRSEPSQLPSPSGKAEVDGSEIFTGERQTPSNHIHNPKKLEGKDDVNSLEGFRGFRPSSPPTTTTYERPGFEYLPPRKGPDSRFLSPLQLSGRGDEVNSKEESQVQNVNPNIITRTIVIHEQPAAAGNPEGLSNRAIITSADLGSFQRLSSFQKFPIHNQPLRQNGGNEAQNNGRYNPQFHFLSASAKLTVGEGNGGGRSSAPTPSQNSQVLEAPSQYAEEQGTESGKPRTVYGVPIAPVLRPDSFDDSDSVIIDSARSSASTSNYAGQTKQRYLPPVVNPSSQWNQNLATFNRLPPSQEQVQGYSDSRGFQPSTGPQPRPSDIEVSGERQRNGPSSSSAYSQQRKSLKHQSFSPAHASSLAGIIRAVRRNGY